MLMTTDKLRTYINTQETDSQLAERLQAVESFIRKYTNNNFQNRDFRLEANINNDKIFFNTAIPFLSAGDTIELSGVLNNGLYTIDTIEENYFTVLEGTKEENNILITKVIYPLDVVLGATNLIKYSIDSINRLGIASETISRHSVTYSNSDNENALYGYPKHLLGFLKPYRKAQF